MSKADNLKDFLTDVADAIRAKKGSTALINPQDFSSEIASLSGGLEIVDMAETTATIEPNKVYVWGMVESLDITLGASTGVDDFFAFRFRCSKPTMTSVTVNGATWAEDTELDAQGKPVLDLGSWYQCEIKGGTSALYARLAHYIHFADSNVEAVLLANGVGDGLGVTYKDAAKVTSISTWFQNNADITTFEEFAAFSGITTLIKFAFRNCSSLERIKLPSRITEFAGDAVFENCTALVEIYLPSALSTIANYAFKGCSSLKELTVPASLKSIGVEAFRECSALTSVSNLENTQVTSISNYTFQRCSSLSLIKLPATIKSIGIEAFVNCSKLVYVFGLENTQLATINPTAFKGCSSLKELTVPASLKSIGVEAFKVCSALTSVSNLENTQITTISGYTFQRCTSLTLIKLPATITDIGIEAFGGCSALKTVVILASTPPSYNNSIPSTVSNIYVPDDSVTAYQEATGWKSFASKIKPLSEYTEG